MGRTTSCDKNGLKKGNWTPEEDRKLIVYVTRYGCWNWRQLPWFAGLARCGKSCRLRWLNYLRPNIKRGNYTKDEEHTIITLHQKLGNRWSAIAAQLPGRTDNEIKSHWHSTLKKRVQQDSVTNEKSQVSNSKDQQSVDIPETSRSSSCETSGIIMKAVSNENLFQGVDFDFLDAYSVDNLWTESYMVNDSYVSSKIMPSNDNVGSESETWWGGRLGEDEHLAFIGDAHIEPTFENFWTQPYDVFNGPSETL